MENKKLDVYYIMNSTGTDAIKEKIKILLQATQQQVSVLLHGYEAGGILYSNAPHINEKSP